MPAAPRHFAFAATLRTSLHFAAPTAPNASPTAGGMRLSPFKIRIRTKACRAVQRILDGVWRCGERRIARRPDMQHSPRTSPRHRRTTPHNSSPPPLRPPHSLQTKTEELWLLRHANGICGTSCEPTCFRIRDYFQTGSTSGLRTNGSTTAACPCSRVQTTLP